MTCCFSLEKKGEKVKAAQCFPVRTDPAPFVATFKFFPEGGRQFVNANCECFLGAFWSVLLVLMECNPLLPCLAGL